MSPPVELLAVSASLVFASAGVAVVIAIRSSTTVPTLLGRYRRWWNARTVELRAHPMWRLIPPAQLWSAPSLIIAASGTGQLGLFVPAVLIAFGPPLLLHDRARRRRDALAQQLDGTLTALANALTTTPNLGDALGSLLDTVDGPMHQEITAVLREVRIGRPIDEALTDLAHRSQIPGFEAAVAAAIMGRRTGGDLPEILRRTSGTLREMARLEGVLRTKTAEGRSQALVMGLVPPLLILALHKIDPHWLEPLWHDPIGWIILGVAALFEVAAIALIKRIMAVDLWIDTWIGAASSSLLALAIGAALFWLWPVPLPGLPTTGERGNRRRTALARAGWFPPVEPLIRALGSRIAALPIPGLRHRISRKLEPAGFPLGLDADELVAAAVLVALGGSVVGGGLAVLAGGVLGPGAAIGGTLGVGAIWIKLDEAARRRTLAVRRQLPQAIDLISLAMQAGQSFPNAIDQVARRMPGAAPLRFELEHLLHKLSLGRSRRAAVRALAHRVPTAEVRQFSGAVSQADRQGTPLADVLAIQAKVMRTRRSQAAEQAAARAGVLILAPMMMIFACVFLILLGPFAIKALRGELV